MSPSPRPGPRHGPRPEPRPELRPEPRPELRPEPRPELRPELRKGSRRGHGQVTVVSETSAGGLVVDLLRMPRRAAVIARFNRAGRLEWCLPKGHLEQGETPEQAAVREIEEETGIRGRVVDLLGVVDYWFHVDDRRVHKHVHHFLLEATGGELGVVGDPDHEAVDVAWMTWDDLDRRLAFPNERRIVRQASARLADPA